MTIIKTWVVLTVQIFCSTVQLLLSDYYCNDVPDMSVNVYGIYQRTYSCLLAFVRYLLKINVLLVFLKLKSCIIVCYFGNLVSPPHSPDLNKCVEAFSWCVEAFSLYCSFPYRKYFSVRRNTANGTPRTASGSPHVSSNSA